MAGTFLLGFCICLTNILTGMTDSRSLFKNISAVLFLSTASYFLPKLVLFFQAKYVAGKKGQELLYLKKMFVVSGGVKPVDYVRVIRLLSERAVYYKSNLDAILEMHRMSNVDKEQFYKRIIHTAPDMDSKLFFEKLELADCYSFDDALRNIHDDFLQQKRVLARKIKKRIELLHVIGVVGMFLIITILMLYLLGPWLENLDVGGWL